MQKQIRRLIMWNYVRHEKIIIRLPSGRDEIENLCMSNFLIIPYKIPYTQIHHPMYENDENIFFVLILDMEQCVVCVILESSQKCEVFLSAMKSSNINAKKYVSNINLLFFVPTKFSLLFCTAAVVSHLFISPTTHVKVELFSFCCCATNDSTDMKHERRGNEKASCKFKYLCFAMLRWMVKTWSTCTFFHSSPASNKLG